MGSNETKMTEFILLGISDYPKAQKVMFALFFVSYLISLLGNSFMVGLIITSPVLHTPMYFFLSNLSFLDIFYTTSSVPQLLVNCFFLRPTISYIRCVIQMSIRLFLGIAECFLLAVMAYDCFAAVCNPLHYTLIMSRKFCIHLAVAFWTGAFVMSLIPLLIQPTQFCNYVINHFACELQALLKLSCSDIFLKEILLMVNSFVVLIAPFLFILLTYGRIAMSVLRIRSITGRRKAFSTCGSHLITVSIFYGSAISTYVLPKGKSSSNHDKFVSLFYGAVIPMFNPLIYSFRNKDVKGAFLRLLGKKISG
uniref:G-protein coupled receptors family 1 profile domain-containing protein n=1 Tax=Salvator merianae TaxID=96440 RepID=A0A8D0DJ59_SALMN